MAAEVEVIDGIREAVLRGEFAPKQRLVEAELCEQFDTSRFVVRAALRALEAEGIVERLRNKGARIREISLTEAIEITEVRRVVEGLVAARAAAQASEADVTRLTTIGRRMREAVATGELMQYSDLNAELHATLREVAQHETANRIIERLHGQMVRHQFALSRVPGRSAVSLVQHERIIAAVARGDVADAEAAMRDHISSVIDALNALGQQASPQASR
ncbi:GntR family transcriptional regulator [Actinotalea sp. M2MS4P-6]|uniref:GntR family transcriptional regulator n=1 Tax=Actinotalea sp. M2MS4P-6 TaxID=2983762 RepID=UPI0021E39DE1|nr:GntR family transcriptional regulator [Actinotalea sp. M2MS4P-6]MCV2394333.1 GntR family transcriptional regulator [Actinotalea sp. M2MS4P-6]